MWWGGWAGSSTRGSDGGVSRLILYPVGVMAAPQSLDYQKVGSAILTEIHHLANRELTTEPFFRAYMGAIVRFPGVKAVSILVQSGGQLMPFCGTDESWFLLSNNPEHGQLIYLAADKVLASLQQVAVPKDGAVSVDDRTLKNTTGFRLSICPILYGETLSSSALQGIQVVWMTPVPDEGFFRYSEEFFRLSAKKTAWQLRAQRLENAVSVSERLQALTTYLSEINGLLEMDNIGVAAVNRAREILKCHRCVMFGKVRKRPLSLLAVSDVQKPNANSTLIKSLARIAHAAEESRQPVILHRSAKRAEECGEMGDYFFHSEAEEVCALPLMNSPDDLVGVLVAESGKEQRFEDASRQLALILAQQTSPVLGAAIHHASLPFAQFLLAARDWLDGEGMTRRQRLFRYVGLPILAVLGILCFPMSLDLAGHCQVLPHERGEAVAETGGRLAEVLVTEGSWVTAGQPLARVDDTQVRAEIEIMRQEARRFRAEADRQQADGNRSASLIAELQYQRAEEEIKAAQQSLERTIIRAPLDGVVLTPLLRTKVGTVFQAGTPLTIVGNPKRWDLVINLPERDIVLVLNRLSKGKSMPVRFVLNALPGETFRSALSDQRMVAYAAEMVGTQNIFQINIPLDEKVTQDEPFKSGYTGTAKIETGWRPLFMILTRSVYHWIRTHLFV